MKKFSDPTDDFFREILRDHQIKPSADARKAFLRDAMQVPPPAKKTRYGLIGLALFLLLSGTAIIAWFLAQEDQVPSTVAKPVEQTHETPLISGKSSSAQPGGAQAGNKPVAKPPSTITKSINSKIKIKNQKSNNNQASINGKTKVKQDETGQLQNDFYPVNDTKPYGIGQVQAEPQTIADNKPVRTSLELIEPRTVSDAKPIISGKEQAEPLPLTENRLPGEVPVSKTDITPEPSKEMNSSPSPAVAATISAPDTIILPGREGSRSYVKTRRGSENRSLSMGVYYSPEWMFNTLDGTKFVNNLGLEGTFHFDRFSIRTGAGLSIAKGANELVVAYNEYLGAFNKLDSMEFTWNTTTLKYVPRFYLSSQNVWDSLMKHDYTKVIKRYTYLQVPLIMGYDFWQSERVSMGVRIGPVLSVLLASKQLSAQYDPGNKRIISINNIAPEQVSLNWQVSGGINTAIKISGSTLFEVEPWIRYYFNSVYEQPVNNAKPFSIGVRAAFVVKL